MTDVQNTHAQRAYARLAGWAYLANYALSVTGATVPASLRGTGSYADKAARAVAAQHAYGAALASSAVGWLLIPVLAYALYVTLAPANRRLAQLALVLQLAHAWMGCITVVLSYLVMRLYTTPQSTPFSGREQEYLISVLNGASSSAFTVAMLCVGAASVLCFVLFWRAQYLPRLLSAFGILASAVLVVVSLGQLLLPEFSAQWQYGWAPMGLAEIATALWLVVRGVRIPPAVPNTVDASVPLASVLTPHTTTHV